LFGKGGTAKWLEVRPENLLSKNMDLTIDPYAASITTMKIAVVIK